MFIYCIFGSFNSYLTWYLTWTVNILVHYIFFPFILMHSWICIWVLGLYKKVYVVFINGGCAERPGFEFIKTRLSRPESPCRALRPVLYRGFELIAIGIRPQLDKISIPELSIDHVKVSAVCNIRNLGTWFDNHLNMKTTINKSFQSGLYHLHNIGRIKRFLSFDDRKSIV